MTRERQPFEDVISEKTRDFLLSCEFSNVFNGVTYIFPSKIPSFCWQASLQRRLLTSQLVVCLRKRGQRDTSKAKLLGWQCRRIRQVLFCSSRPERKSIPGNACLFLTTCTFCAQLGIGICPLGTVGGLLGRCRCGARRTSRGGAASELQVTLGCFEKDPAASEGGVFDEAAVQPLHPTSCWTS